MHKSLQLRLLTLKNPLTGNDVQVLAEPNGSYIYYREVCSDGIVLCGQDARSMYWVTWIPSGGKIWQENEEFPTMSDALTSLDWSIKGKRLIANWQHGFDAPGFWRERWT